MRTSGPEPPYGTPPDGLGGANGWGDYRLFVLDRLQTLFAQQALLDERVRRNELRFAVLLGIWSAAQAALALWAALK